MNFRKKTVCKILHPFAEKYRMMDLFIQEILSRVLWTASKIGEHMPSILQICYMNLNVFHEKMPAKVKAQKTTFNGV